MNPYQMNMQHMGQQSPRKKGSEDFNQFMINSEAAPLFMNTGNIAYNSNPVPSQMNAMMQQQHQPMQKIEDQLDYFQEKESDQKPEDLTGYIQEDQQPKSQNTNAKNTYIRKLNALMKKSDDDADDLESSEKTPTNSKKSKKMKIKSSEKKGDVGLNSIDFDEEQPKKKKLKLDDILGEDEKCKEKLARNCESARNSRKRKKIYLELLENKVIQLSEFLEESKKICQTNQNLLQNLNNQIAYKNELQSNKVILFQNLHKAIECNTNENNINAILDSMQKKFGTTNQERLMALDYCFKQIDQQGFPIHMKYILWAAANNKDIFDDKTDIKEEYNNNGENNPEEKEEFESIIRSLKLTDVQSLKLKKMKKKFSKEYKKMDTLMNGLHQTKNDMKNLLFSLDQIMVQLRKEFKPSQISKFLQNCMGGQSDQTQIKSGFNRYFNDKLDGDDLDESDDDDADSETDLYNFIKSDKFSNQLMVDINEVYDIYADAHDFLNRKKNLSVDII